MTLAEPRLELDEEATVEAAHSSGTNPEMAVAVFRTMFVLLVVAGLGLRGQVFDLLSPVYIAIVLAGIYNAALLVMYWRDWSFPGHRYFILSLDVVFVSVWIGLSGAVGPMFFPLYYALAVIAALWFGTLGAAVTAVVCGGLYVGMLTLISPQADMTAGEALRDRVPFLILVALLSGYIADAQKRERRMFESARLLLARYSQQRHLMQGFYDLLNPPSLSSPPGLEVGMAFRPALRMGAGDYYDLLELEGRGYAVCVADVAGKYGPEVLRVPVVKYALKLATAVETRPARVLERVNELVFDQLQPDRFATMFYAEMDAWGGEIAYVNAGHNPALLVRADETVTLLEQGGLVLGVLRDARYEEGRAAWNPGDALVAYTDGAVEARGPGGEEFGVERLREAALRALTRADSALEAAQAILAEVDGFAQDAQRRDDVTVLVARPAPHLAAVHAPGEEGPASGRSAPG